MDTIVNPIQHSGIYAILLLVKMALVVVRILIRHIVTAPTDFMVLTANSVHSIHANLHLVKMAVVVLHTTKQLNVYAQQEPVDIIVK